jgi:hypothetical protein
VTIEFAITRNEIQEAHGVHLRSLLRVDSRTRGVMVVMLLAVLALAVGSGFVGEPGIFWGTAIVGAIALLLVSLVVVIVIWARSPTPFRGAIEQSVLTEPRQGGSLWIFDGEGITVEDRRLKARMRWAAISRAVESENLFVLYSGENSYCVLPKRAFGEGQLGEFRRLLHEGLTAPIGAFPVVTPHKNAQPDAGTEGE